MKIVTDTKKLAAKHDVKIILKKTKGIKAKGELLKSNGYFCSDPKVLAVAVGKPEEEWLPIFVHESCHLDQYIEDYYTWEKLSVGYSMFFEWIEGNIELDDKTLVKCFQDIIDCELDCEKRTIKKIKKYGLNINITNYIKMANTYLYSYSYIMECRKWKNGIYMHDELISLSPSKFQSSYLKIPIKMRNKFRKFYED